MNKSRYLSVFIGILAVIGVSMVQFAAPNQEIIVQFSSSVVSSEEASDAVLMLKEQLQELGADNIHIQKRNDGTVKISYYSAIDVSSVKRSLATETHSAFGLIKDGNTSEIPSGNASDTYQLSVYEIQKGDDFDSSLNGCAVEIEHKNVQLYNPILYAGDVSVDIPLSSLRETNSFGNGVYAFKIPKEFKRGIPECRAGPRV